MKYKSLLLGFLFFGVLSESNRSKNFNAMENAEKTLNNEVLRKKTPSVQYVIFNTEGVIYEHSSGFSDLENRMRPDRNTTFNVYSITKTFTALAILQLVEEGKLDLDDSVRQHLPHLNITPEVTVLHLLTHTSGLANPLPLNWIHLANEHKDFDRNGFFNPILEKRVQKELRPGSKFKYSNLGYILLGQIIETVTNDSYENYIAQNIFEKLDLKSDFLGFEAPHKLLHAKGYHNRRSFTGLLLGVLLDKKKFMKPAIQNWDQFNEIYVNGAPYGGLIGNTSGFVKFGQELLKENSSLLSNNSKELFFSEDIMENGTKSKMGMSWFHGKLGEHSYISHAGGGGGYYCELRIYPSLKKGSFIIFNRSGFKDERFLDKVDSHFIRID